MVTKSRTASLIRLAVRLFGVRPARRWKSVMGRSGGTMSWGQGCPPRGGSWRKSKAKYYEQEVAIRLDKSHKVALQTEVQYYSRLTPVKLTGFIQRLDQWLRARIRQYIWKQWKKFKTKITNLQKLGMSYQNAYKFTSTRKGYRRTAHSKILDYSLTNRKLEPLGLINLSKTLQPIQSD